MRKSILLTAAAAFCLVATFVPSSYAAMAKMGAMATTPMKCDDAAMTKMQGDIDAMTDAKKKTMAMKEMGMAKAAMMKHKMKTCSSHMMKAEKGMM